MNIETAATDRRGWWWVVGLLAVCPACLWGGQPVHLRVLTYNIHHGVGTDGKLDLSRIASVIKRLAPDVVALQEVDNRTTRSGGVDQAEELGRLTGMQAVFGKAMDYAGGQYGEALLSRYPLSEVRVHELPFTSGCEPRCVVAARLRLPEGGPELFFAGTHLEHARGAVRLCQAGKLSPYLAEHGSGPIILAGDFNDVPGGPTIKVLQRHWTYASDGAPVPTFPATQPARKLDYVFYRPADRWRVVKTHVAEEPVASDHRPLLVVLEYLPEGR